MISAEQRNGNLFIQLQGTINPEKVEALSFTLADKYSGRGNVFINTEGITEIPPSCAETFGNLLKQSPVPDKNIYLIGEAGFRLTDGTTRVITRPPKKDRCTGCKKRRSKQQQIIRQY